LRLRLFSSFSAWKQCWRKARKSEQGRVCKQRNGSASPFAVTRTIAKINVHLKDSFDENLALRPEDYQGPALFADFNPEMTDDIYQEEFPYIRTQKVILRNVTTASGKALRLSDNPAMFNDVEIITD
jgi:hypothetical protein